MSPHECWWNTCQCLLEKRLFEPTIRSHWVFVCLAQHTEGCSPPIHAINMFYLFNVHLGIAVRKRSAEQWCSQLRKHAKFCCLQHHRYHEGGHREDSTHQWDVLFINEGEVLLPSQVIVWRLETPRSDTKKRKAWEKACLKKANGTTTWVFMFNSCRVMP